MRFRLVVYDTDSDNKYDAIKRYEYFADKEPIFYLWFQFVKVQKKRHVDVFSLDGTKQNPEYGISDLVDYNV